MAGRHYLEKQGKSPGVPEEELIRMAVRSLGLNDVAPFEPEKKIIEYQVREPGRALVGMTLRGFADELSMDSPAPGGGSVAALCGALSAALAAMVANLTVGKKGYEAVRGDMIDTAVRAQALKDALLEAVDADTRAFNKVMEAFRLPKTTPEQAEEKDRAVEEANKEATLVPLDVLERPVEAVGLAKVGRGQGEQELDQRRRRRRARGPGGGRRRLLQRPHQPRRDQGRRLSRTGSGAQAAGFKKALDKEGKAVREHHRQSPGRAESGLRSVRARRDAPPLLQQEERGEGEKAEDDDRRRRGDVEGQGQAQPAGHREDGDGGRGDERPSGSSRRPAGRPRRE